MIVVMAMLDKRTVCINKLKSTVGGIIDKPDTKVQSHYTRLIRFFRDHSSGDLWIHIVRCGLQLLRLDSRYLGTRRLWCLPAPSQTKAFPKNKTGSTGEIPGSQ